MYHFIWVYTKFFFFVCLFVCVCDNSDTRRMEELFSKNQQMKEQQRLLNETIQTLENRCCLCLLLCVCVCVCVY